MFTRALIIPGKVGSGASSRSACQKENYNAKPQSRYFSATIQTRNARESTSTPKNLSDWLDEKVKRFEFKDLFVDVPTNQRWTYVELQRHTSALAVGLINLRLKPQERMALMIKNDLETVTVPVASAKAGVVTTYFPPEAGSLAEVENLLNSFKPKVFMFHTKSFNYSDFIQKLIPEVRYLPPGDLFKSSRFPFLKNMVHTDPLPKITGVVRMMDAMGYNLIENPLPKVSSTVKLSDPTAVYTTNNKGLVFTQSQLLNLGLFLGEKLGFSIKDRVCVAMPMTNLAGQAIGVWACIANGAVLVNPSREFDVDETFKALSKENCTVLVVNGSTLKQLLQDSKAKHHHISTLQKVVVVTGESLSKDVLSQISSELHAKQVFAFNPEQGTLSDETSGGSKVKADIKGAVFSA